MAAMFRGNFITSIEEKTTSVSAPLTSIGSSTSHSSATHSMPLIVDVIGDAQRAALLPPVC